MSGINIETEVTGFERGGMLFREEPARWRGWQRDIWHCCPRKTWMPRPYSGHELFAGELRLSTTDQRDRGCGWCWHVSVECTYDGGELAGRGGFASEAEAQAAAIAFVRTFCATAIGALPEDERATRDDDEPPRRCEFNEVDLDGSCMACGAIQGERCQKARRD